MRQYQFKTINPQFHRNPNVTMRNVNPSLSQTQVGFSYNTQNRNVVMTRSPVPIESAKLSPILHSIGSPQSHQNLPNMKKQLEVLLQQTAFLEARNNKMIKENSQSSRNNLKRMQKINGVQVIEFSNKVQKRNVGQKVPISQHEQYLKGLYHGAPQMATNSCAELKYQKVLVNQQHKNKSYSSMPIAPDISPRMVNNIPQKQNRHNFYDERVKVQEKRFQNMSNVINPKKQVSIKSINPEGYEENKTSIKLEDRYSHTSYEGPGVEKSESLSNAEKKNKNIEHKGNIEIYPMSQSETNIGIKQAQMISVSLSKEEFGKNEIGILRQKVKNLQAENIKLQQNLQTASQSKQYYREELTNEWKRFKKIEQEHERKLQNQQQLRRMEIQKQKEENRAAVSLKQQQIIQIKQQHTNELQVLRKEIEEKQMKIINLVKQIKVSETSTVDLTLNSEYNILLGQLEHKEFQIMNMNSQLRSREDQIKLLNESFVEIKTQIQELSEFKKNVEREKYENFDEILITQMHKINSLKQDLQSSKQTIMDLKLSNLQGQTRIEELENQINILNLKHKSEIKSVLTQSEIQMSNKDNFIGTLQKKILTLEEKLKSAVSQIKFKDQFVKQYLVGRSETVQTKQYIQSTLSKYETLYSESREQELEEQLKLAKKKIQLYQKYA